MIRNDYRRALIMMRSMRQGVSGYVRLERRTLIGTMQFTVNNASEHEELYALLLYPVNGLWYAHKLDKLGPVRYGQSGLVYRFDPRDIDHRTLEEYKVVAVASIENGVCGLLLAGFLNNSMPVDWEQVREAACRQFSSVTVSQDSIEEQPCSPIPVPEIDVPGEFEIDNEETVENEMNDETEIAEANEEIDDFDRPAQGTDVTDEFDIPASKSASQTAADQLNIDIEKEWPDSIEPLRQLFMTRSEATPFEEEGFVLIETPMGPVADCGRCIVGIACDHEKPSRVLFGIPARYSKEPPSGLEGYVWRGNSNEGYWVIIREI